MERTSESSRARRSPDDWTQLIAQSAQSPLTTRDFCKQAGINLSSFYLWRKRLKNRTEAKKFSKVTVRSAVQTPVSMPQAFIEVVLPNGSRVRVLDKDFDENSLRRILAVVAEGVAAC